MFESHGWGNGVGSWTEPPEGTVGMGWAVPPRLVVVPEEEEEGEEGEEAEAEVVTVPVGRDTTAVDDEPSGAVLGVFQASSPACGLGCLLCILDQ
jgi:hypothetical protein